MCAEDLLFRDSGDLAAGVADDDSPEEGILEQWKPNTVGSTNSSSSRSSLRSLVEAVK